MSKYVTIEVHMTSDDDDDKRLYLQAFELDYLMKVNPCWLNKIIVAINNLEEDKYV